MSVRCRPLAVATFAAAAALTIAGAAVTTASADSPGPGLKTTRSAAQSGIFVQGNQVRRDSYQFKSRGVIFEGFQFPLEAMQQCVGQQSGDAKDFCQRHIDAQNYYFGTSGTSALDLAKTDWHANTVRLNLGQVMLDPQSALYNKTNPDGSTWGQTYLARVKQAVSFALSKNMVVELALFNYRLGAADPVLVDGKSINDYDPKSGLPSYRTNRAVAQLGAAFKGDDEVLLELYNEPFGDPGQYVNGHASDPKVAGINTLAATARSAGVRTPLIVQGPSANLNALPIGQIKDHNAIFSSHPFLGDSSHTSTDWDRLFGDVAKTRPVLITAWGARGRDMSGWCQKYGSGLAKTFLKYVHYRTIGLSGFAFDVNGTIVQNFQTSQDAPTTFPTSGDTCNGAAGADIQGLFGNYAGGS